MSMTIRQRKRQRGLSTVGWIAVVGLFGLIVISFFKVFPMYYENFKLQAAMENLQADVEVDSKSKRAIWESLQKRMFVDEIRSVKRENVEIVKGAVGKSGENPEYVINTAAHLEEMGIKDSGLAWLARQLKNNSKI